MWNAEETGRTLAAIPRRGQIDRSIHSLARSGDDGLVRPIPVGSLDLRCVAEERLHGVGTSQQGRHGAGISAGCLLHGSPAFPGQRGQPFGIQGARGVECHELAITMTGHHVGLETQAAEQVEHSDTGRADGRLSHLGWHQGSTQQVPRGVIVGRRREDERSQDRAALRLDHTFELLEGSAYLGEHDGQFAQHVGSLRTLPREEERHSPSGPQWLCGEEDPPRIFEFRPGPRRSLRAPGSA